MEILAEMTALYKTLEGEKSKTIGGDFRSILPLLGIIREKRINPKLREEIVFRKFEIFSICYISVSLSEMKIYEDEKFDIEFSISEKSYIKVSLWFLEEHANKGKFVIKEDEYE